MLCVIRYTDKVKYIVLIIVLLAQLFIENNPRNSVGDFQYLLEMNFNC